VIEILRGHSNADIKDFHNEVIVSVIEILRGHSNVNEKRLDEAIEGLSDRNPTWPLEHKGTKKIACTKGFMNIYPGAIWPNFALSQKTMVLQFISQ
jgi:hypothetical protein